MYQSLIIFLNRCCPVGCASCNAGALPGNTDELPVEWLCAFFRKVKDLPFSGYIVWTGGEPFLAMESLGAGVSLAARAGYHSEILTGGVWFARHPERLETAAAPGNVSLRISLDAEHREAVPLARVIALVRRALELEMEVNFTLRDIPGRKGRPGQYMAEIKKALPEFYRDNCGRSRWLHYMPHIPIPGTRPGPAGTPAALSRANRKPCRLVFRDLVTGADGMVYPCCGLFTLPFHRELAVGDPLAESWDTLAARQEERPLFRFLRENSPCHVCLQEVRNELK